MVERTKSECGLSSGEVAGIKWAGVLAAVAGIAGSAMAWNVPTPSWLDGDDTTPKAEITQPATQPAKDNAPGRPSNADLVDDFAHYVNTANYEMAHSVGAELLARKLTNVELMNLIDAGDAKRFEAAAQRAIRAKDGGDLQLTAGALLKAYETGKLELARNPDQIAANIKGLVSPTARGRLLARAGLVRAGEYATPQLLQALLQDQDPALAAETQSVMVEMGRQSITPLSTAMLRLPPVPQERIARVLGLIPYKQSLPYLVDLRDSTDSPNVRTECQRSIDRLGGTSDSAPALYRSLAEAYYAEKSEVTSFAGETHQLLWSYMPAAGLVPTAIRTPVYHEASAMAVLERAMQIESKGGAVNPDTLALWVASNYSREFDTPEGYINPAYPVEGAAGEGATPKRGADYFGVASGPNVAQRVLARGLVERDTPLVRRALAAVEKTAGGRSVLDGQGSRTPLAMALTYPNRRVQADAALAIASAQPMAPFAGSERVVPTLASTLRGATEQYAAIVTTDSERYQTMRGILEKAGFKVLPQGGSMSEMETAVAEAPAVDLVVGTGLNAERSAQLIIDARSGSKTGATPVLVVTSQDVYIEQSRRFASDKSVAIRPAGTNEGAIQETIKDLVMEASGGPISADEASAYAARSLNALKDLAVSNNPVMRVQDAAPVLMAALADAKDASRVQIADVLARVPQERAQRAVLDAALNAEGEDRVALLNAASASAKRFGNLLEERHIKRVVELATSAGEGEATAAASLMGALGISNQQVLPLILGSEVAQK